MIRVPVEMLNEAVTRIIKAETTLAQNTSTLNSAWNGLKLEAASKRTVGARISQARSMASRLSAEANRLSSFISTCNSRFTEADSRETGSIKNINNTFKSFSQSTNHSTGFFAANASFIKLGGVMGGLISIAGIGGVLLPLIRERIIPNSTGSVEKKWVTPGEGESKKKEAGRGHHSSEDNVIETDTTADELIVSEDILLKSMPGLRNLPQEDRQEWLNSINDALNKYEIEGEHTAMFLAQIGHESADLSRLEENMNYSAERLMAVWPTRFNSLEDASNYAFNPEALANNVYGDRMGNTEPGDGWLYRGRGAIQLTGRENYQLFQDASGWPVVENPDLLVNNRQVAIEAAAWYYSENVTSTDINIATYQINCGYHGIDDRAARYQRILENI